jgi:hypothetical protein
MKFYYDGIGYPCKWKTKMLKDMWYSMAPVKLKVILPISVYDKIKKDIENVNEEELDIWPFKFKILKANGEYIHFNKSVDSSLEIWKLECHVNSFIVCSEFRRDGLVTVNFDILVIEYDLLEKSEIRDIILNEITN